MSEIIYFNFPAARILGDRMPIESFIMNGDDETSLLQMKARIVGTLVLDDEFNLGVTRAHTATSLWRRLARSRNARSKLWKQGSGFAAHETGPGTLTCLSR